MDVWREKAKNKYIRLAAAVLGVFLFMKFLLPLVYPFVIAALIVIPLHPHLERLEKKTKIGKGFLTTGILFLGGSVLIILLWLAASWAMRHISSLAGSLDIVEKNFHLFVSDCCRFMEDNVGLEASNIENLILERVDIFIENFQVSVVPRLMDESVYYVKAVCSIVAFIVITFIATILLAKDYDEILERARKSEIYEHARRIIRSVGKMIYTFLRAQAVILFCISVTSAIGLLLAGVKGGVTFGVLAGTLDALPFIGTGIVLMPLALWKLAQGNFIQAAVSVALYVACALIRECLEPRLIGKRMGILPVGILASVYVGVKVYGLAGVILGPLSLLLILEIIK